MGPDLHGRWHWPPKAWRMRQLGSFMGNGAPCAPHFEASNNKPFLILPGATILWLTSFVLSRMSSIRGAKALPRMRLAQVRRRRHPRLRLLCKLRRSDWHACQTMICKQPALLRMGREFTPNHLLAVSQACLKDSPLKAVKLHIKLHENICKLATRGKRMQAE